MLKFDYKESDILVKPNGQELLTWTETDGDEPIMVYKWTKEDAYDKYGWDLVLKSLERYNQITLY